MTEIIDSDQLTKLIRDPLIVRIFRVLDIASLSILELSEYNLTRKDINYALLNGIAVGKSAPQNLCYLLFLTYKYLLFSSYPRSDIVITLTLLS